MKVLLDTCVWGKAAKELRAADHDVLWTGDWDVDPGDREILDRAHAEQRILVTLDKDFGDLAVAQGQPHHGIIRVANVTARRQATVILHVLEHYGAELLSGAIITVDPGRVRIRSADEGSGGRE